MSELGQAIRKGYTVTTLDFVKSKELLEACKKPDPPGKGTIDKGHKTTILNSEKSRDACETSGASGEEPIDVDMHEPVEVEEEADSGTVWETLGALDEEPIDVDMI
jgi:hypothetical protein